MDELEKGRKDTEIRRDTQVRGSLGVPPSGKNQQTEPEREPGYVPEEDDIDRMSER